MALLPGRTEGQLPPDEVWRTLETPHFRVTYPEALEGLARRAGERGETAWRLLEERFVEGPSGKVDMVVTDHADISNGLTNVFPSNRILIFAPPPMDGFSLSHMDEWMELVVTHELVHVFHQDMTQGLSTAFRRVFGRIPTRWPTFPGSATPGWAVEGIATYYESALTEAGRVRGSFHEMVLRTAILEGGFESINQASSEAPVWPGGQRYYIYGSLFLNHLLEEHGEAAMTAFVEAVAGQWVPFRMNSAARTAFGESFTQAWEEWEKELEVRYRGRREELAASAPLTVGERLTEEGQYAMAPALSPDGHQVAFARYDSRSDPQIRLVELETGSSRKLTRINRLANLGWTPEGDILFSQTEYTDSYRIRGDLYLLGTDGQVNQLTRGARLDYPDVAPTGEVAIAVQEEGGTNRLVLVGLESGEVQPLNDYDPLTHWAYPRWSPNGKWIAVSRWLPGAFFNLVILDREGRVVHEVTRDRAVDTSPSWSPDGRWLLWSSDQSGIPNLYAVEIDPETGRPGDRRQITNLLGGAASPVVDTQNRWIYYSGYHTDGWHIERIPFDSDRWFTPFASKPSLSVEVDTGRYLREAQGEDGPYNPLHTLLPTYWSPEYQEADEAGGVQVLDPGYGISTSGRDLIGRHSYALSGTLSPGPGGFNGGASYSWAGLRQPTFSAVLTQYLDSDGPYTAPDESGDLLYIVERERSLGFGATFTRRRARTVSLLTLSGSHIWEHRTLLDASLEESGLFNLNRPDSRLAEGRAAVSFGNARLHPFSISPEDGVGVFLRGRVRRELALDETLRDAPGEDRSFQDLVGQVTAYRAVRLPGFGNHVLAVRGSGGVAQGPGGDAYHFEVGGASGGERASMLRLGEGLLFPVRGYGTAHRFGRYAWSATAEYRFPLLFVNGGPGLIPLHLDWLSGTVFMDGGNAWGSEWDFVGHDNPRRAALASFGGEITARILPLWYSNVEFRFGVAVPLMEGDGARAYIRIGPAF